MLNEYLGYLSESVVFRLVASFHRHLAGFVRPNGYDELLLSCDRRQGGHMTSEI